MTLDIGGEIHGGTQPSAHLEVVRTFGALATRLNDALGRARHALQPHAGLLPEGMLSELDALLAEFERRRVRIAIYGEVKAGKSTLLNAIAGAALSPVAFEPLTSLPVRVTYGEDTVWRAAGQPLRSISDLEHFMRNGLSAAADANGGTAGEVVVETDLDLLQLGGQVDLLDTPGVGSAAQFDARSAAALRALDAVVLVVRYPALFTQFTRRLMEGLQEDIGKLFVVWNLDADCAELTAEERARHAETLRANMVGAHELYLIDARAAFRAMQANDGAGSVASGLTAFIAGLRRFASSGGREVAALREAAKRTQRTLEEAQASLRERHGVLERALADARARLLAVQAAAHADAAAARTRFAEFDAAVTRIGQHAAASATRHAADLRRQVRSARRQWAWRANFQGLATAVTAAISRYADAARATNDATVQALHTEAANFGTAVQTSSADRIAPALEQIGSDEHLKRATIGRGQWLRRTLWHRWYLPGLAALERTGIAGALNAHVAWLKAATQAARDAAQATLTQRLAEIAQHADAEEKQIEDETNLAANQEEFERINRNLPVVSLQQDAVAGIGAEARALI